MKNLSFLLVMLATLCLSTSCKKETTTTNDDTNPQIPDTYFEVTVTGDQTDSFNITIPASTPQTTFSIIGSHVTVANLLSINARQVPTGWGVALNVSCQNLNQDTYLSNQMVADISAYSNTDSPGFAYLSTSASVTLSKVDFFAEAQNVKTYYIDGTFSGTLVDPNDASKVVNISGKFRGISIQQS